MANQHQPNVGTPLHGTVTFFESRGPPKPFNVFGMVPEHERRHQQQGPQPPPGPPPSGPAPSSSSTGDTSLGPTAADFRQRAGVPVEQAKELRQPTEFAMNGTDDDGNWNEIYEMDANDGDGDDLNQCSVECFGHGVEPQAGQVFKLGMLKNCLRRKRTPNAKSPFAQFMTWTLSGAAHAFFERLCLRHGAQEEVHCGDQQPSSLSLRPGDRGGPGRSAQEEDGKPQDMCGLVTHRDRLDAAVANNSPSDGLGLPPEEGHRAGRAGHRERWGEEEEVDHGEVQGDSNGMDSSRNWTASEAIHNSEVLGQGTGRLPSPSRVSALQGKPRTEMVDMSDLRVSMGTSGRRSNCIINNDSCSRDARVAEADDKNRRLPTVPTCTEVQTRSGCSEVESGPHGNDLNGLWSDWIQSGSDPKVKSNYTSRSGQGSIAVQGKTNGGSSSIPKTKEGAHVSLGPGRSPGAGGTSASQRSPHDRQRRGGPCSKPTGRILADKSLQVTAEWEVWQGFDIFGVITLLQVHGFPVHELLLATFRCISLWNSRSRRMAPWQRIQDSVRFH